MKIGVLADVHGNFGALDVAINRLGREGARTWLHLGDAVGYGPQPGRCVERLRQLGAVCVAGNHDLAACGRLPLDDMIPLARTTLEWTREQLDRSAIEWLAALPLSAEPLPGLTIAHGSLDDARDYVRTDEAGHAQLTRLPAGPQLLLLGHTHEPWLLPEGLAGTRPPAGRPVRLPERALLNPGSVGQSRTREPWVRCLLLDLERREATWLELPYDHAAARRELRRQRLPRNAVHLRPKRLRLLRRLVRRLLSA